MYLFEVSNSGDMSSDSLPNELWSILHHKKSGLSIAKWSRQVHAVSHMGNSLAEIIGTSATIRRMLRTSSWRILPGTFLEPSCNLPGRFLMELRAFEHQNSKVSRNFLEFLSQFLREFRSEPLSRKMSPLRWPVGGCEEHPTKSV